MHSQESSAPYSSSGKIHTSSFITGLPTIMTPVNAITPILASPHHCLKYWKWDFFKYKSEIILLCSKSPMNPLYPRIQSMAYEALHVWLSLLLLCEVLSLLPSHIMSQSCVCYTLLSQGYIEALFVPSPETLFPFCPFSINTHSPVPWHKPLFILHISV